MVFGDSDPEVTVLFLYAKVHTWAGLKFRVQNNSTFNIYNENLHLSHSPEQKSNINIAVVD